MKLGRSLSRDIREQIRNRIDALDNVAKVYTFMRFPLEQDPTVFVLNGSVDGEFSSNVENRRTYGYRIMILYGIGQDRSDVTHDRMQYAEEAIGETAEDILNTIEEEYELGNFNAEVLFVRAMNINYSEVEYEGGYAKSAEFTVNVVTEHNISS